MKKSWTRHCSSHEEAEEFRQLLAHSQRVLVVLKDILEEKYDKTCKDRRSLTSYVTQNWSEYQADKNATERTLLEIIDLLPIGEN